MSEEYDIQYSERYKDNYFEYRHVIIPKSLARQIPSYRLLSEFEWRAIGIQQSRGWEHYLLHKPEPHILLFRRPIETDQHSGKTIFGNNNPYNWKNNDINSNRLFNSQNDQIDMNDDNNDNEDQSDASRDSQSSQETQHKPDWKPCIDICLPSLQTNNQVKSLSTREKLLTILKKARFE